MRPPCLSPTPKLAQSHVHWVSDAIQPSHPLLSPASPPAFCLCQHRGLIIIQKMSWPHITLIHCRFISYICFLLRKWPTKLFKYILFLCSWHFHSSLLHHISSSHLCDVIVQRADNSEKLAVHTQGTFRNDLHSSLTILCYWYTTAKDGLSRKLHRKLY